MLWYCWWHIRILQDGFVSTDPRFCESHALKQWHGLSQPVGQASCIHVFTTGIYSQRNKSKVQAFYSPCSNFCLLLKYFSTSPKVNICIAGSAISAASLAVLHLFTLALLLSVCHSTWHSPYFFYIFPYLQHRSSALEMGTCNPCPCLVFEPRLVSWPLLQQHLASYYPKLAQCVCTVCY